MCNSSRNFLHIVKVLNSPQFVSVGGLFPLCPSPVADQPGRFTLKKKKQNKLQRLSESKFYLSFVQYMGSTESNRTYAISQLVGQWTHIRYFLKKCWKSDEKKSFLRESWLRVESWKSWCTRLLNLKMRDIMVSR